jgi:hypothetical protein
MLFYRRFATEDSTLLFLLLRLLRPEFSTRLARLEWLPGYFLCVRAPHPEQKGAVDSFSFSAR